MAVSFRNHQLITRRDEMRQKRSRWPITTGPMLLGVGCFSDDCIDVLRTISNKTIFPNGYEDIRSMSKIMSP